MQLSLTVDDAWNAAVHPTSAEVRLDYTCPTCGTVSTLNLQPPPWRVPTRDRAADETEVPHDEVTVMTTQLWCHRCQKGASAELRAE
jgi:hypothetical protein